MIASTLTSISEIATALGVIIAAGAAATGFIVYKINRRDDEAQELRETIATARATVDRLAGLVGFELGDELVRQTVYGSAMQVPLEAIFSHLFAASPDEDASRDRVKKMLGSITVAAKSDIARDYEAGVADLTTGAVRYQTAYPGLYRVLRSLAYMFHNVLSAEKALARDEKVWSVTIAEMASDKKASIESLEQLRYWLSQDLIAASNYVAKEARKGIGDLKEILDLVAESYLALDEAELRAVSRKERRESLIPVAKTKTITEDLREAEKALQHVLAQEARLAYREVVTRFDARNPEPGEDDDGD